MIEIAFTFVILGIILFLVTYKGFSTNKIITYMLSAIFIIMGLFASFCFYFELEKLFGIIFTIFISLVIIISGIRLIYLKYKKGVFLKISWPITSICLGIILLYTLIYYLVKGSL